MGGRRNLSGEVYTDISSTTLAHMQAATGLKLSLALYVAVQDKQKYLTNPSRIFDFLGFVSSKHSCCVVSPGNVFCGATQALAVGSPGPVPQLHYSTFIFSLEHSLVGPQVCLYAPKPTALFCCWFSPSVSSASYGYA